jgi:transposase
MLYLDIEHSCITFDSAFDSEANRATIISNNLIPVIRPNRRNIKNPEKLEALFQNFDEETYQERFTVERCFAWQHVYRKLVIRYERLQETHLGFRHLAYSMINFRSIFS